MPVNGTVPDLGLDADAMWPESNSFSQTMLGLEYQESGIAVDSFSSACVSSYLTRDTSRYDYPISQVFEPGVLAEVAELAAQEPNAVESLEHAPSRSTRALATAVEEAKGLSGSEAVTTAAALISISRFRLARHVLSAGDKGARSARESFEVSMLQFIASNRTLAGADSASCFRDMKTAIIRGSLPEDRILDACTQAVVWYLKRREIPKDLFAWFAKLGNDLVTHNRQSLTPGTVSSWFRGVAMLTAELGNPEKTRALMIQAKDAADQVLALSEGAYESHFSKTYYESSIKEHMYVERDLEKSLEFGRALVELDPVWSASYGELAEVHRSFGQLSEAAELFDQAVRLGAPYVKYHLKSAADLYDKIGRPEEALKRYAAVSTIGHPQREVLETGQMLAKDMSHGLKSYFDDALRILAREESQSPPRIGAIR